MPVPEPSVVLLSVIEGFWLILQQTPRAVTAEPPSFVTLPPPADVVAVIADKLVVVRTGARAKVAKVVCSLYPVPMEFIP